MPSAYCQYRLGSARPSGCGQSEPNITLSHPTVATTSATLPSQNGLTHTLRRNTSCGCSGKFCGILLYVACRSSKNGLIQALPFSTLVIRSAASVQGFVCGVSATLPAGVELWHRLHCG